MLRHYAVAYDPLSGEGARQFGGRWNSPGSFPVIYAALDEATMAREFRRMAARTGLLRSAHRRVAEIEVELTRVLDLTDTSTLDAIWSGSRGHPVR